MKKRVLMCVIGLFAALSLTGCNELKDSDVVVTVGETEITADLANFYARYMQAQYETFYGAYLGEDMWDSEAEKGKTYEEFVKDSALKDLEDMVLLEKHMKDYEIELTEKEQEVIKESAKTFGEDNSLEQKNKVSGSEKVVERVMTLMAIRDKMHDAIAEKADKKVSEEEMNQKKMQYVLFSYTKKDKEENETDLSEEEKKDVKKSAEDFAKSAKTESDFGKLAKQNSVEVQTATFDAETTIPDESLVAAADKLKKNGVTGVVETEDGRYVAKVVSLKDKKASEAKKKEIISERKEKLYEDTCKGWRKEAGVKVNKSVWKKVDFNDLGVTMKQEQEVPYADDIKTDDQAEAEENAQ